MTDSELVKLIKEKVYTLERLPGQDWWLVKVSEGGYIEEGLQKDLGAAILEAMEDLEDIKNRIQNHFEE